jgi:hypothetical protein
MTMRSYVDSAGHEWQVFDVVPRTEERRRQERRGSLEAAAVERERREGERRLTVGAIARLPATAGGWLCFERGSELRRLSPIPRDWARCPEAALQEYCRAARPGARASARDQNESAAIIPRR